MSKKFLLIFSAVFFAPLVVSAQLHSYGPSPSLQQMVTSAENVIALVFSAIAVIMFVIAGILFLTAQGEPDKVKTARAAFMWGIAGVIVGIIAFSIIAIVSRLIT